ncbi:hypothetical protein LEP1GSC045_1625 [Leptospira interrogans serovar Pomona str. Kennewicki LC82-25]|nr:hypothetical protein LEP1GSC045_1625 [Leptospira interrogans serovar Pomona str. Kennewicki LC82-25]EMI60659.1 hypothetical protein LEP1GSC200_2193 [Leptospira interrogans serovar Pomona str. CSL10083]EMJ62115.1 hypothetical protein LEP1GSC197_1664 [Leptospira interrogans serovar Pomona str. CSL4002]EMN82012.1 hypothetical protein LEP1GSC106_1736 [Leptospira interrogans serovar Grippotyphosa str. UI 12764]EMN93439.1 hypothetical protein LEP1GSC110_1736 [Leptospira interrogans serovar Medanen
MSCRKIFNFRQYVGSSSSSSSSSSVFLNQFSLGKRHIKNERLVL